VEKDQNIPAHEKRRLQVYADDEDVVVRVLGIPEADYECVMVNGSWAEKSLLEGDIVLCADGRAALAGDIVLIEEEGRVRLGVLAEPGFLETRNGSRPIEASERIVGVGVALARKLSGGSIDFSL
jgi:SOS-response transcriptional repressor LexA